MSQQPNPAISFPYNYGDVEQAFDPAKHMDLERRGTPISPIPEGLMPAELIEKLQDWNRRFSELPLILRAPIPSIEEVLSSEDIYDFGIAEPIRQTMKMLQTHLKLQVEKKALLEEYEKAAEVARTELHEKHQKASDDLERRLGGAVQVGTGVTPQLTSAAMHEIEFQMDKISQLLYSTDAHDTKQGKFIEKAHEQLLQFFTWQLPQHNTQRATTSSFRIHGG